MKNITRYLTFILLFLVLSFLTGCHKEDFTRKNPKEYPVVDSLDENLIEDLINSYLLFKDHDFSNYIIYIDPNYYQSITTNNPKILDIFYQNQVLYNFIIKIGLQYIEFDYSKLIKKNNTLSEIVLTYNDYYNPIIERSIQVFYYDITINSEEELSNIEPKKYLLSFYEIIVNNKKYEVEFNSFGEDIYEIRFLYFSPNSDEKFIRNGYKMPTEDYCYLVKESGPKTFFIDGIPILKVWKDKLGYRVNLLYSENNLGLQKYYVYSLDLGKNRSYPFYTLLKDHLYELFVFDTEMTYTIQSIEYEPINEELKVNIIIYNSDMTVYTIKTFTLVDYDAITFTTPDLEYNISITRENKMMCNITFIHKNYINYEYSFSLKAN